MSRGLRRREDRKRFIIRYADPGNFHEDTSPDAAQLRASFELNSTGIPPIYSRVSLEPWNFVWYSLLQLGIVTGNPGVFQGDPYPHLRKPAPAPRVRVSTGSGKGFQKPGGTQTRSRVSSQSQPINLASAVRVSIDTAVQSCEVISLVNAVTGVYEHACHLHAREMEARMVSKRHPLLTRAVEARTLACEEGGGRGCQNVVKIHLRLALACEGSGRCESATETP
jgi:hypothetical protein